MKNRSILTTVIFVAFAFTLPAGATTVWTGTTLGDGLWTTSSNWTNGVPTSTEKTVFNQSSADATAVLDATGSTGDFPLGDGGGIDHYVEVDAGGELSVNGWCILGYNSSSPGRLTVDGGDVTVSGVCRIGYGGDGELVINSGTFTANSVFSCGSGSGGAGTIYLDGGILYIKGTWSIEDDSMSIMDITAGAIIKDGWTTNVYEWIDDGRLTAYGGTGYIIVEFDPHNDETIITASETDPATSAEESYYPLDGYALYPDESLGWPQETGAVSYNVYLGTDYTSVENAQTGTSEIYKGNTTNTAYTPSSLVDGLVYYWRIDSVDSSSNVTAGEVISFFPGVDNSTMTKKIMCGYQMWFRTPDDPDAGGTSGFTHYGNTNGFLPGSCSIDYWPDMSEMDADEKFLTTFVHSDSSSAYVYNSTHTATVNRHLQWMQDYGIHGVFVQKFGAGASPAGLVQVSQLAPKYGRTFALMYDIGSSAGIENDFKLLVDELGILDSPAYMRHNGKPVIAVWGFGFGRAWDDAGNTEAADLLDFFANDPIYGGNCVMVGVDNDWKTVSCGGTALTTLIQNYCEIVSPWEVGRYSDDSGVETKRTNYWDPDISWCNANGVDYLPVNFPGFSWYNLQYPNSTLDQIKRRGGKFLWKQFYEAMDAGAKMVYIAMFDEMDEGTAIFKCAVDPPAGDSPFVNYYDDIQGNDLPSDHYLWLVGQGQKMLAGEISFSEYIPWRTHLNNEILQDFEDNSEQASYTLTRHGSNSAASVSSGVLQLLHNENNQKNTIGFDHNIPDEHTYIRARWDMSIETGADGMGFILLDTDTYGVDGASPQFGEEANKANSFGVAFDIYNNIHEVSLHWNNSAVANISSSYDYRTGNFEDVVLEIEYTVSGAYISVTIAGADVYDDYYIAGMAPYQCRPAFGGRTGGAKTNLYLDNINIISQECESGRQDFQSASGQLDYTLTKYGSNSAASISSGTLQLLHDENNQKNVAAFDRVAAGIYDGVAVEWDFSVESGADGFSLALLNTSTHGATGSGPTMGESANVSNALGIGFDIYNNIYDVTLHWNSSQVERFSSPYDYRTADFEHAEVEVEFIDSGVFISVAISGNTVYDHYYIDGIDAYESRVSFGSRTGGVKTNLYIDDVHVRYINPNE